MDYKLNNSIKKEVDFEPDVNFKVEPTVKNNIKVFEKVFPYEMLDIPNDPARDYVQQKTNLID